MSQGIYQVVFSLFQMIVPKGDWPQPFQHDRIRRGKFVCFQMGRLSLGKPPCAIDHISGIQWRVFWCFEAIYPFGALPQQCPVSKLSTELLGRSAGLARYLGSVNAPNGLELSGLGTHRRLHRDQAMIHLQTLTRLLPRGVYLEWAEGHQRIVRRARRCNHGILIRALIMISCRMIAAGAFGISLPPTNKTDHAHLMWLDIVTVLHNLCP